MRHEAPIANRPFNFAGAWIFPVMGMVISLVILAQATRQELTITAVVLAVASVLFLLQRGVRISRT
jgi:hypothetical protein